MGLFGLADFPETRNSLIVQLQTSKDIEAWEQFVLLYRPVIYRLARRRGLQDADAQDLSQNVLLSVANSIGDWQKQKGVRFRNWLSRISKNAILNALSRESKNRAIGGSTVQQMLLQASDAQGEAPQDVEEQELELEYQREVYQRAAAIVKTDVHAKTWQAFQMTVVEGMSIANAAEALGRSVGTVYASRSRILKRLKQTVAEIELAPTPRAGLRES